MIKIARSFALVALALFVAIPATAATWKIDPSHSVLDFKVRHMFSKTGGTFDEWSGTIAFDGEDLSTLSADITVQTASINTSNENRDNHLRTADFFDVENHPTITFKSTKAVQNGEEWELHGDFTMLGVTKPIVLTFEFVGAGSDPWGNTRAGFEGEAVINRKDFGMEWNKVLDAGGALLGEEVSIDVEIAAVKQD